MLEDKTVPIRQLRPVHQVVSVRLQSRFFFSGSKRYCETLRSKADPNRRKLLLTLTLVAPAFVLYLNTLKVWPMVLARHANDVAVLSAHGSTSSQTSVPRIWRFSKADSEVRQVVFAKVHKAASSTVQNILLRFAIFRDLKVLMGNQRVHLSDRVSKISNIIPHPGGQDKTFDILCSHVIYDAREIAKYFKESAVRVAILREPLHQAVSALAYYSTKWPSKALKAGQQKHPTDPINGFLQHPEDFYNLFTGPTQSYINNRMSVDLGFGLETFEQSKRSMPKIKAFLKQVEEQFDLVLISDYFHESMILMKRYLKWSMKDIVFRKNNEAKFKNDSIWRKEIKMTPAISQNFRKWNLVDYELYEHFKPIFLRKIQQEPMFEEEVTAYKNVLTEVEKYCSTNAKTQKFYYVPKNEWTEGFVVTSFDCELMIMSEMKFVRYAQKIQWKRYTNAHTEKLTLHGENLGSNATGKPPTARDQKLN
ncbi:galactose-3-O-sulfotransferase 3 [Elysia marginata]|uniref:Galactose-3-O-sulfotransferase 3 n=1 Tax=Elysia marginata TaxID=1093978 RepID=A0AAV4GES4_9GAST|nr:galactose-3-O-sulfotransferase 3 [Elysia marginata]